MIDKKLYIEINGITQRAGRYLSELSKDPESRKPRPKADGSPVTDADIKVSELLVEELSQLGFPVVSEECLPENPPDSDQPYFLVDPLDGTKYFSRGEDEFAVCVGLLVQGSPVYGSIFDPTRDKLFWGAKGLGAFCNEQPINHDGVDGKLVVYSSGFHKKPQRSWVVDELNIGDIREKGSALKFCDIASGDVDFYLRFGPTSEWDTAAAQIILEESNCVLLDPKTCKTMVYGKKNYLNNGGLLACHKSLEGKAVKLIKEHLWKRK